MINRWFAGGALALGCLGIWTQQPGQENQQQPATPVAPVPAALAAPSDLAVTRYVNSAVQEAGQAAAYNQGVELYSTAPGQFALQTVNGQNVQVYRTQQADLQKWLKQYRDAEPNSEQRGEAHSEISKLLAGQYDGFMTNQEKQIEELEQRLVKLREQLQRRREAKSRMVELKLEMVLSQADGLGWPEGGRDWFGATSSASPLFQDANATLAFPAQSGPFGVSPAAVDSPRPAKASGLRSPGLPSDPTLPPASTTSGGRENNN